ncbi:notchless protein homolog 1 [Chrysoperla carnea]|uniref:notchless protein homolog 1 n=1 Tax=Chrysoperla carnea TaxID=189513 RepID=UPI001D084B0A|nr:notchless protein homolog 1 [Chrysoperla carnea]
MSVHENEKSEERRIISRFKNSQGDVTDLIDLPVNCTVEQLTLICNAILQQEENVPYLFFVDDQEIKSTLGDVINADKFNTENVLDIVYQQQAIFRVRAVSRCTSSLPGHAEAVISVNFSPNGRYLASGSGDTTVRFWDINTQTPEFVCKSHTNWVLCIAWSPDSKKLASACKDGKICVWDPTSGKIAGPVLSGHRQWVTGLAWEPYHSNTKCIHLASSSKDGSVRIWDVVRGLTVFSLTAHNKSVTCIKWGGAGLIYTGSQDRTIKVWRAADGVLCRTLEGHAHWVNTLALSTDYVLRTGPFNPGVEYNTNSVESEEIALKRYKDACPDGQERLVSGSDDFTLFLWHPEKQKTPIARLTGHQQLVNDVKFSPDASIIASASFDKSIKLWHGSTGKFIGSLRGHVQAVYVIAWSADSRLLVSGSADSTLKVWNVRNKKIELDLPGHADEVFAVDWSPTGLQVASGGKDKVLKLWAH